MEDSTSRTIVAKTLDEYPADEFSTIKLFTHYNAIIHVRRGSVTKEKFELIKNKPAFVILEARPNVPIERITNIIKPFKSVKLEYRLK